MHAWAWRACPLWCHKVCIWCEPCQHDVTSIRIPFVPCRNKVAWHRWCSRCRNTMSSWFELHGDDVGMISSCSHHIHITLMTSSVQIVTSLWHVWIMVAAMVRDRQTLRTRGRPFAHDASIMVDNRQTYVRPKSLLMTGRPSRMTYRPWWMTGRPIHALGVFGISSQYIHIILMYSDMFWHQKRQNYVTWILVA